ncbi:MAG TPA: hypothetical protein VHM91_21845, partial [Verrucomicrobiales bacterium]|nr:hypothetical protein [Verrucomicrobiales bacterium]
GRTCQQEREEEEERVAHDGNLKSTKLQDPSTKKAPNIKHRMTRKSMWAFNAPLQDSVFGA